MATEMIRSGWLNFICCKPSRSQSHSFNHLHHHPLQYSFTHHPQLLQFPSKTNCSSHSYPHPHSQPGPISSLPLALKLRSSVHGKFCQKPSTIAHSLSNDSASVVDFGAEPVRAGQSFAVKKAASDVSNDLKGTSIFLVGMNNAMKTSVGKVLAESLRYYFFDSDTLVEEAGGSDSSGKSFRDRDEDGFRESETEALKQLSSMGRLVVSAGNGAVQNSTNLGLLRHGICIWIDVPLELMAMGSIEDGNQPEVLARLTMLYEEHRGGYATADASVSLLKVASKLGYDEYDQVTPEDMVLEVLKELEKLTRVKKMKEAAGIPF